jgi:hypothetical protein
VLIGDAPDVLPFFYVWPDTGMDLPDIRVDTGTKKKDGYPLPVSRNQLIQDPVHPQCWS